MSTPMTVQEDCFKHWCDTFAPGTYDRLTEEEKEKLREVRRLLSGARRTAIHAFETLPPLNLDVVRLEPGDD